MNKALRGLRGFAAATSLAILVQGLGTIALTPGADALDGQVTTTTRVHVRTGPSTSNKSLTVLNKGDKLTASGSSNGWTKVTWNGKTAYVASAYLMKSGPASSGNGTSESTTGAVYTTANLNLRTGPSTRDSIRYTVQRGTQVVLTGKVNNDFAQLTYKGVTLWGSTRYLSGSSEDAYQEALPKVVGKKRGTTALMVRTTSTTGFTNLGDAPKGTIFDVTGVTENGMAQVIYNNAVRWVNAKYLVAVDDSATGPAVPEAPATTAKYATTVLNIWAASKGTSYSGEIPKGGTLATTGKVENGRAEIVHNGAVKWVTAKYVSATKPSTGGSTGSGSGSSLNKGYSSGLDQTNENVKSIVRDVWSRYPQIKTMYGWRRDVTPDHPAGRAVDVMIPSYKSNSALGWEIAKYYQANASKYNINYIIFDQKIWSVARNKEGWRAMASRGGDTANHKDHVHINTYG